MSDPGSAASVAGAGSPQPAPSRQFGLDLMRAIAISVVLLWHCGRFFKTHLSVLVKFEFLGFLGVELFFVLSGFLIGGVLMREFRSFRGFETIQLFWARRWFRTLPNYYFFLAVNVLLWLWYRNPTPDLLSYSFFVQNLYWPIGQFFSESWSLAVEEWFYVLLPLSAWLMQGVFRRSKQPIVLGALLMAALSILARAAYVHHWPTMNYHFRVRKIVIVRFDSLACGVAAAWLRQAYPTAWLRRRGPLLAAGVALLVVTRLATQYAGAFGLLKVFVFTLAPVACALMLPYFDQLQGTSRRPYALVGRISLYSYSMYLINELVFDAIEGLLPAGPVPPSLGFVLAPISLVAIYFSSKLVYRWVERPFMRLREAWYPAAAPARAV